MKIGALVSLVLGGLTGILVLGAGALYLGDYGLEANVVKQECGTPASSVHSVTVKTKILGIESKVDDLDYKSCTAVNPGALVVYHIRTGRTLLYKDPDLPCTFDSSTNRPCTA